MCQNQAVGCLIPKHNNLPLCAVICYSDVKCALFKLYVLFIRIPAMLITPAMLRLTDTMLHIGQH